MFTEKNIKLMEREYCVKPLKDEDEGIVQQLCERCSDFFEITEAQFPPKDAGYGILHDLPRDRDIKDKNVFGCFNDKNVLVAVIDILRDYPEKGEWITGLLMLDPKERGKGLGKELHEFIKGYAREHKADKLRIGVVEDNVNGMRFWTGLGYREIKRVNMKYGNKDNVVIVMNLKI